MEPEECYTTAQNALYQLFLREQQVREEAVQLKSHCTDLALNQDWNSRQLAELEQAINDFITDNKARLVLYGSRAINTFLPKYLRVETSDWDFFLRVRSVEELQQISNWAVEFLQVRFPARRVWCRNSFHNPNNSFGILVSQRHVLDFSLPPEGLPDPQLRGGLYTCPLSWLINNIEAILAKPTAQFRWEKDRNKLLRLLWAASDKQLSEATLSRSSCVQTLTRLGEAGRPLLEKVITAKEQKQALARLRENLQEQEQVIAQQNKELGQAQRQLSQDRTEKLEAELKQLKQSSAAQITELKKQNSRLQQRLDTESESKRKLGEKFGLEQKLEQAKHKIALDEKEKLIEQLTERISELTLRVEDSVKLQILEDKLQDLLLENKRIKVDYTVKSEKFDTFRSQVEADSERLKARISQLEASLSSSNRRASESIRQIIEQKNLLEAQGARLEKCERELASSEQCKKELLDRFHKLRGEIETKFCELGLPLVFGFVHWSKETNKVSPSIQVAEDTVVWLCKSCEDGSTRLPEPVEPCAVLKLSLGNSDITMPVKRNGTMYSICNSCFYENLFAT